MFIEVPIRRSFTAIVRAENDLLVRIVVDGIWVLVEVKAGEATRALGVLPVVRIGETEVVEKHVTLSLVHPVVSLLILLDHHGMAVAAATGDAAALRICNSVIARGAIAAGVSGSGPAIAIVCYEQGVEQLTDFLTDSDMRVIHSRFIESEPVGEEASPWE